MMKRRGKLYRDISANKIGIMVGGSTVGGAWAILLWGEHGGLGKGAWLADLRLGLGELTGLAAGHWFTTLEGGPIPGAQKGRLLGGVKTPSNTGPLLRDGALVNAWRWDPETWKWNPGAGIWALGNNP